MLKLTLNERLVIESGPNRFKLVGPGWIWIKPWQRILTRLNVAAQGQALQIDGVRTQENIPMDIATQILYHIDPALFADNLLSKIQGLNDGGWSSIIRWRTEQVLRQMVADYSWRELGKQSIQQRLERQLTQTLAEYLKVVGLKITSVCLVKIELPEPLQRTIIQSERDGLEPRGRAQVLKEYFDIFGHDLTQAMPYIVQWELLNALRKNGKSQFLLASPALSLDERVFDGRSHRPVFQMQLPLAQES